MAFLYGDCSPSPLTLDYLGYLRRTMSLAVEVLLAEDRLVEAARRRRAQQARTAELEERLEALHATARQVVDGVARSPDDDLVIRCANQIQGAVDQTVTRAIAELHAQDEAAASEIAGRERAAHASCLQAVETYLRSFDLPDAENEVELEAGEGGRRAVILRGATPYGIVSELELDARGSVFAAAEVRAGSLAKTRTIEVKLDKLYVARVRCDAARIELGLRAARDGRGDGFDVVIDRAAGGVTVERATGETFVPITDDERAFAAVANAAAAALEALRAQRVRLRALTIDEVALEDTERPSTLIDRAFAAMRPQVRAIVQRSQVPSELSLRRELGDGVREEIFVTHAELAALVAELPMARRHHFDALGLPGLTTAGPPTGDAEARPDSGDSEPSISIVEDDAG